MGTELWWVPLVLVAPLVIMAVVAGLVAVFARDPGQRADAHRVLHTVVRAWTRPGDATKEYLSRSGGTRMISLTFNSHTRTRVWLTVASRTRIGLDG